MSMSPFHPELRRLATVLPRASVGPRTLRVMRRLERLAWRRRPAEEIEVVAVGPITVRVHRPPARERSRFCTA
jgi:hypothetical protein